MSSMTTRLDSRYIINPAASSSAEMTATIAEVNAVADQSAGYGFRAYTGAVSVLTTAETNILTLPAGAIVLDVIVNITTAESTASTKTIDVGTQGTSNDPNGFFASLVTSGTGTFSAMAGNANAITTGLNETFRTGSNFTGALLTKAYNAGSDAAEDTGIFAVKPWFVATADPVSYTLGSAHTELDATITVIYLDVNGL